MKILIVRFAAIGDCVMTAWAVTALRNAEPQSRIYWAAQKRCVPVIDTNRLVDHVECYPREEWKAHRWSPSTWRQQLVKYTALRKHKIDVGFDFQGHSKTALCLRLSGCKERLSGRATDQLSRSLNRPVELNPAGPHEVQHAMALLSHRFEVALPELPLMPVLPNGPQFDKMQSLVTIQTGAGEADKLYPATHWKKVADVLVKSGAQVACIGGENDPRVETPGVHDLVGKLSLLDSMSWVAASQVHLAADTGTGHIAAAYGVPTVSLFGRTDPARFRPWSPRASVLRNSTDLVDVPSEQVVEAAMSHLEDLRFARVDL